LERLAVDKGAIEKQESVERIRGKMTKNQEKKAGGKTGRKTRHAHNVSRKRSLSNVDK